MQWEFVPLGCQYRNGLCKRRVAIVKMTLTWALAAMVLFQKPMLTYNELQTILSEVANVVNDRAVRPQSLTEEDLVLLTVNQLLLGRNSMQGMTFNEKGELCGLSGLIEHHQQVLASWWKLWWEQSLSYLLPFYSRKDVERCENLWEGDICLLNYKTRVVSHYWLCVIMGTMAEDDSIVRTVMVSLQKRCATESRPLHNEEFEVGVQRLPLIMLAERAEEAHLEEANQE